jgi:ABC-type Fe3+/spermidine/putrescine transport system ATPase subunit
MVEIIGTEFAVRAPARERDGTGPLAAVLSPDKIHILTRDASEDRRTASGTVARVVFTGTTFLAYVTVGSELEVKVSLTVDEVAALGKAIAVGARVGLEWDPEDVILVQDQEA